MSWLFFFARVFINWLIYYALVKYRIGFGWSVVALLSLGLSQAAFSYWLSVPSKASTSALDQLPKIKRQLWKGAGIAAMAWLYIVFGLFVSFILVLPSIDGFRMGCYAIFQAFFSYLFLRLFYKKRGTECP